MMKRSFISAACALLLMSGATAQTYETYQQRRDDLYALSSIFGELHHIRRTCEPRLEADIWRERMKTLVDLEEPEPEARNEMVARFNKGYRAAQEHFPSCDRRARDHAAARASQGETIIARLTAPLEEALEDDDAPFIWQGGAEPSGD